jgi:hypothetical protein
MSRRLSSAPVVATAAVAAAMASAGLALALALAVALGGCAWGPAATAASAQPPQQPQQQLLVDRATPWVLLTGALCAAEQLALRDASRDWQAVMGQPPVVLSAVPAAFSGQPVLLLQRLQPAATEATTTTTTTAPGCVGDGSEDDARRESWSVAADGALLAGNYTAINVTGYGTRGFIYALLRGLSGQVLQVEPWQYWMETPAGYSSGGVALALPLDISEPRPAFLYRGWCVREAPVTPSHTHHHTHHHTHMHHHTHHTSTITPSHTHHHTHTITHTITHKIKSHTPSHTPSHTTHTHHTCPTACRFLNDEEMLAQFFPSPAGESVFASPLIDRVADGLSSRDPTPTCFQASWARRSPVAITQWNFSPSTLTSFAPHDPRPRSKTTWPAAASRLWRRRRTATCCSAAISRTSLSVTCASGWRPDRRCRCGDSCRCSTNRPAPR